MKRLAAVVAVFLALAGSHKAAAEELRAAVHVHTVFGGGEMTPLEVAELARSRGLDVVFLTDHDLVRPTYGLPPFDNLLAAWWNFPSVLDSGVEHYLKQVRSAAEESDVIMIPGAESSPHAYWRGDPWSGMELKGWFRHLLLLGMGDPQDWEALPIPRNPGRMKAKNVPWIGTALALVGLLLSAWLAWSAPRSPGRRAGCFLAGVCLLNFGHLVLHPMSPWPMQGPGARAVGWAPHQEVIDHAREAGAVAVWAHPDAPAMIHSAGFGPIEVSIRHEPYPEALRATHGYGGFEGLIGAPSVSAMAGGGWDEALAKAVNEGTSVPWVYAGQDFDSETDTSWLGEFQVVLRPSESTPKACLEAIRHGRFYALRRSRDNLLNLERYRLVGDGVIGESGDEVEVSGPAVFEATMTSKQPMRVRFQLLQDGEVVADKWGRTPLEIKQTLADPPPDSASYVRMIVEGPGANRIFSNPIVWRKAGSVADNS